MSFTPLERLRHVLDEADFLIGAAAELSREDFDRDPVLQRAFTRSLEIMGEAVKTLPNAFRQEHPEIEWRLLAGMRDRLIHRYFAVDYEVVWDVVTREVPRLRRELQRILETRHFE